MSYVSFIMVGRVGSDPEEKQSRDGDTTFTTMPICADDEWHRLVAFGKSAHIINKWIGKGDQILVRGHPSYWDYRDASGDSHKKISFIVDQVRFLDMTSEKNEKQWEKRQKETERDDEEPESDPLFGTLGYQMEPPEVSLEDLD